MRFIFTFLFFIGITLVSIGQITVTNTTFPVKGDVLKMAITDGVNIDMGRNNGPQTWDFSTLNSGFLFEEEYIDVSEGSDPSAFPNASMILKIDGSESYIRSSSNKLEIIGVGGENDFIPFEVSVNYSSFPVLRRAPLNFIDSNSGASAFNITIPSSILPPVILEALPIRPDSIRIKFENSSRGVVDAFGTLKIQNQEFQVLREKTEDISETKAELRVFGQWLDAGAFIALLPPALGGFLGKDTTYTYNFYTDSRKEVLVSAEYNVDNELESVTFVNLGNVISSTEDNNLAVFEAKIFPNPVSDKLNLSIPNIQDSNYLVTLTDMTGRVIYMNSIRAQNGLYHDINVQNFSVGHYILDVRSQHNKVHFASKVVVNR
jgi:hypothetical protein